MARDERLKMVQDAGADFIETARAKAEDFLRELARAGGDTQGRGRDALDDLIESGRKGTEGLASAIRREIHNQLAALGLATKTDLAGVERRLGGRAGGGQGAPPEKAGASTAAPKKAAPKKAAPKKAAPRKAAAEQTAPKKAAPKKTAVKKAAPAAKAGGGNTAVEKAAPKQAGAKKTAVKKTAVKKAAGSAKTTAKKSAV